MSSAAMIPTTTDGPRVGRSELVIAWPSRAMWIRGPSADSAVEIVRPAATVVMLAGWASQVTRAKAKVPSRLTGPAPLPHRGSPPSGFPAARRPGRAG